MSACSRRPDGEHKTHRTRCHEVLYFAGGPGRIDRPHRHSRGRNGRNCGGQFPQRPWSGASGNLDTVEDITPGAE